ncbi:hypothetical protein, partial [Neptunomonas qingdaonensis]
NAFNNHTNLSDDILSQMGFTEINAGSSSTRLADLNADELEGNVLIIAAKTESSNDEFKIQHLNVQVKESACESDGECAPIIIEAEDMYLKDYKVESNSAASGEAVVKLSDNDGYVKTTFDGESGNYDFTLNYIDENDGYGMLKIKINGSTVKTINLDQQVGDHKNGFASVTIDELHLSKGDEIKVSGWKDSGEYARIDSIVLENCDTGNIPMNVASEEGYFDTGDSIDLSNVERLESSSTASRTSSLSSSDLGMEEQTEFAYEGDNGTFDALDIPDMTVLGTADDQQVA